MYVPTQRTLSLLAIRGISGSAIKNSGATLKKWFSGRARPSDCRGFGDKTFTAKE